MFLLRDFSALFLCLMLKVNSQLVSPSIEQSFRQCLISQPSNGFGYCLGFGAISKLQSLDSSPEFDLIDGVTLTRENKELREDFNYAGSDPSSFRTIIDTFSHVFSERNLKWDMGFVYPGLAMQVAPSASPGGMLEFVLDPNRESLTAHSLKEAGTGTLLARQFVLPFLLGFKFKVVTILPILFGLLALIAKKAIILSKVALIISSAFGLATLLLGSGTKYPSYQSHQQHHHFSPAYGAGGYTRYSTGEEYQDIAYRGLSGQGSNDQLRLYGNLNDAYDREDKTKGRNFAWSEAERSAKTKRFIS